jgi:hypothetical protein
MPSIAYRDWTTTRAAALNEIARAHVAVGGSKRGRRYATQQLNCAYAVLLASQFQGFCRDLHKECVDHVLAVSVPDLGFRPLIQAEFLRGRQLDRGNAQSGSIGADFGRLKMDFWAVAAAHDPRNAGRRPNLDMLNAWRNAIAHQDFDAARLGGTTTLRLAQVRRWRGICHRLAQSFDETMRLYLLGVILFSPW